jgi:hypothetical protein
MDQTDRAHDLDPLRSLAEAALGRQETAQRQRADDQAAVDRDQAAQAEAGQVLRRTDTCGSWNPWDTNYPHQGSIRRR